ncbi:SHOCT domain-containing protein [Ktedonobacteria bacterium brp13]|nr:SHOCT domain-containing protein [Ktedonobacteria bacterium brp13]
MEKTIPYRHGALSLKEWNMCLTTDMVGRNSAQQAAPPLPAYPPQSPYQGPPATPGPAVSMDNGTLAQLQLLGKLHSSGVLTDDEFEREKQQIMHS